MSTPSPTVFVTGVTGYVGGDALSVIVAAHPDWSYVFLVRSESRVSSLVTAYPSTSIRTVIGDILDTALLTKESAASDIVINFASSDDVPSMKAIVKGLGTTSSASKPNFLIHISGTGNIMSLNAALGASGDAAGKVWDDIADLDAVHAWDDTVYHHPVERIVLDAHKTYPYLKTAIICPPAIVGLGRGPGNTRTMVPPALIESTRKRGRGFKLGAGKASWSVIHVADLSDVFLRITEAAAAGGGNADWGYNGWYFVENGDQEWGPINERIAQRLFEKGEISTAEVDSITPEQATEFAGPVGGMIVGVTGTNSRCRATRTRKVLGWVPTRGDFDKYVDEQVDDELKREGGGRIAEFESGNSPAGVNMLAEE